MRKVVTGDQVAQIYNRDPLAFPIWRAPVYRTPGWIIAIAQLCRFVYWLVRLVVRHPVVSLVLAVPLSAIGGGVAHLPGLLVAWAGIVGVNVVQAARVTPNFFGRRRAKSDSDWED